MTESDPVAAFRESILEQLGSEPEHVAVAAGEAVFREGDAADAMYFIVSGRLAVTISCQGRRAIQVAELGPGEPVGELGILAGGVRTATVTAIDDAELLRVPAAAFERSAEGSAAVIEQLADVIRRRLRRSQLAAVLPRLFGPVDGAMIADFESRVEWVLLRGGEVLLRQGDEGDSLYILVSGRLRAVAQDDGGATRRLNEIAPGETVGEMALITGEARSATVYALRDSKLVRLDEATCEELTRTYPQIMAAIARMLTHRLRKSEGSLAAPRAVTNIAVLPASPDVPLGQSAERLADELSRFGPTLHLNAERFDSLLGIRGAAQIALDAPRSARLATWFDQQEARHEFVVLEADPTPSAWTSRCVRQADQVVLVAEAGASPTPGAIETESLDKEQRIASARRYLVLLHPDGSKLPTGTGRWLSARQVDGHYHVRRDTPEDYGRVARCLAGRSIGLVLGGGGARGLAHIGVVRALREAGVPIDLVGGTSMGAIIAGFAAMGLRYDDIVRMGKRVFLEGRPHKEYTLPLMSIIRSRRLDRLTEEVCEGAAIEDLWLPFFCVSCNLTTCQKMIHRRGPLWKAIRASASLPGVFLPVIDQGSLLVDGGVLNNLPGDIMRQLSGGPIIAVAVSPEKELAVECQEFPSPWRVLRNRIWRSPDAVTVPSIIDVLMRTIVVSSDHLAEQVKLDADLLLTPPIQKYGLLQFEAIDEIARVGYAYARERIEAVKEEEWLRELLAALAG